MMTTTTTTWTREAMRDRIVALYLRDGRFFTVKELAEETALPEARVRRLLRDPAGHLTPGLNTMQDWQQTYSRAYPMMEAGMVRVTKYGPTLPHLREMLLAARGEMQACPHPTFHQGERAPA